MALPAREIGNPPPPERKNSAPTLLRGKKITVEGVEISKSSRRVAAASDSKTKSLTKKIEATKSKGHRQCSPKVLLALRNLLNTAYMKRILEGRIGCACCGAPVVPPGNEGPAGSIQTYRWMTLRNSAGLYLTCNPKIESEPLHVEPLELNVRGRIAEWQQWYLINDNPIGSPPCFHMQSLAYTGRAVVGASGLILRMGIGGICWAIGNFTLSYRPQGALYDQWMVESGGRTSAFPEQAAIWTCDLVPNPTPPPAVRESKIAADHGEAKDSVLSRVDRVDGVDCDTRKELNRLRYLTRVFAKKVYCACCEARVVPPPFPRIGPPETKEVRRSTKPKNPKRHAAAAAAR